MFSIFFVHCLSSLLINNCNFTSTKELYKFKQDRMRKADKCELKGYLGTNHSSTGCRLAF
ncbi:hypothetical protein Hanom_Chr11g01056661 [Helianthus anomalus]